VNVPLPKSLFNSVKIAGYFDMINLTWNFMVVNELKSPCKNNYSKFFFNVHVKKIKTKIYPKMVMIWTYENMALFRPFKSP